MPVFLCACAANADFAVNLGGTQVQQVPVFDPYDMGMESYTMDPPDPSCAIWRAKRRSAAAVLAVKGWPKVECAAVGDPLDVSSCAEASSRVRSEGRVVCMVNCATCGCGQAVPCRHKGTWI